jgi:hypothetical protein
MDYLKHWRMQIACDLLRVADEPLSAIASVPAHGRKQLCMSTSRKPIILVENSLYSAIEVEHNNPLVMSDVVSGRILW